MRGTVGNGIGMCPTTTDSVKVCARLVNRHSDFTLLLAFSVMDNKGTASVFHGL